MPVKKSRVRLDTLIFERGLTESRERAQRLILAGEVLFKGEPLTKPGLLVDPESGITIKEGLQYVSRGGLKLKHALDFFDIDPSSFVCADVGASTGGFTDCLLQSGAVKVYAIDVGYGQLAWKLRQDPRVIVMERQNARFLEDLTEEITLAVMDVSFISVELLLPVIYKWLCEAGQAVVLVKPQFEAGKGEVGKGGVVKDTLTHRKVLERITHSVAAMGYSVTGLTASPITGPKGNIEFLMHLAKTSVDSPHDEDMIDRAIISASQLH